jgi:hypothetical protein
MRYNEPRLVWTTLTITHWFLVWESNPTSNLQGGWCKAEPPSGTRRGTWYFNTGCDVKRPFTAFAGRGAWGPGEG